jgi:hypothetical protein
MLSDEPKNISRKSNLRTNVQNIRRKEKNMQNSRNNLHIMRD